MKAATIIVSHYMKYDKMKNSNYSIYDAPRERLEYLGAQSLKTDELIAVILGSGVRGKNVHKLAKDVLRLLEKNNYSCNPHDMQGMHGMGRAKTCLLLAVIEFARRLSVPKHHKILQPTDVMPMLTQYRDRKQEYFICISLNGAHEIINTRIVSIGLVNQTLVHPREVYADALVERSAAIIVAHNHPSGNLEPSREDKVITQRLLLAGKTLGIELLDHIIFSATGHYSFSEEGMLK